MQQLNIGPFTSSPFWFSGSKTSCMLSNACVDCIRDTQKAFTKSEAADEPPLKKKRVNGHACGVYIDERSSFNHLQAAARVPMFISCILKLPCIGMTHDECSETGNQYTNLGTDRVRRSRTAWVKEMRPESRSSRLFEQSIALLNLMLARNSNILRSVLSYSKSNKSCQVQRFVFTFIFIITYLLLL